MYCPKELEGEVDHSFFDSDCDGEDGQTQNGGNSESKQQSLDDDVGLDSGGSSNEHVIKKHRRDDNNSQIENTSVDPNEIKKAALEVVEPSGVKEKEAASDSESIRQNEHKDGLARDVIRNDVSSQMPCEQWAADNTDNDRSAKTAAEMEKTCLEKEDEIKDGGSVLLRARNEQDGLNIGGEDSSQEQNQGRSIADPGSLCSSVSSLASGQDRDPGEDECQSSRSPSEVSGVSSAEERELEDYDDLDDVLDDLDVNANEDGYQRSDESGGSDEDRPPEPPPPRHKPQPLQGTPRKSCGKFRNHSPRPSSSSELESSCSSDAEGYGSSSSCELSPPRRALAALAMSSPRRRPRLGSVPGKERAHGPERPALESEDTVTDVTPLSTPDMSPAQSFDLPVFVVKAEEPGGTITTTTTTAAVVTEETGEKPKHHDVTIDLNVTADSNFKSDDSDQEDLFAIETQETSGVSLSVKLEDPMDKPRSSDQEESSQVSSARERSLLSLGNSQSDHPSGRQRRNFSFRNDEVWRIDRENQRLLRELSQPGPRSRSASTSAGSAHTVSSCSSRRASGPPPPPRLYHSAINRQREQKRIERENLAFLKRLESVKPSKGITRAEQLADYQRQARYLCTPLPSAIEGYHSKLEASLSRGSQGNSTRPYSAGVRLGPRSGSRPSPAPTKPSRSTTPRPAWS